MIEFKLNTQTMVDYHLLAAVQTIAQRTRAWQNVAELGNNHCSFKTCQWMQVVAHCNQSSYAF
jgi:hypothetical protein